jgi:hypothetical protein
MISEGLAETIKGAPEQGFPPHLTQANCWLGSAFLRRGNGKTREKNVETEAEPSA